MREVVTIDQLRPRILIVTLPIGENYGGILQAYALQRTIRDLGYEVCTTHVPKSYWRRQAKRVPGAHSLVAKWRELTGRTLEGYADATTAFVTENIRLLEFSDAKRLVNSFEAVIVGSDQVWRERYASLNVNFLRFVPDPVRRISYAASFGVDNVDEYSWIQQTLARRDLRRFNDISVREDAGVAICEESFGVSASCHIDPTMLMSSASYLKLILRSRVQIADVLFSYVLDRSVVARSVSKRTCTELSLTCSDFLDRPSLAPVEDWLVGIAGSKFVVTDSFHGTVFAIIFNKPFVTIVNEHRGSSRIVSLLTRFGLLDRLVSSEEDVCGYEFTKPIDWITVNRQVHASRIAGLEYLKSALGGADNPKS